MLENAWREREREGGELSWKSLDEVKLRRVNF